MPGGPQCGGWLPTCRAGFVKLRRGPVSSLTWLRAGGVATVLCAFTSGWMQQPLAAIGKVGVAAAYTITYLYTCELFPTQIRSTSLGVCSQVRAPVYDLHAYKACPCLE